MASLHETILDAVGNALRKRSRTCPQRAYTLMEKEVTFMDSFNKCCVVRGSAGRGILVKEGESELPEV